MLQQTRVDQARAYFERFMSRFPSLESLAKASIDEVLKVWEGLGYYARARNLHRAAQTAYAEYGKVPDTYEALIALPGIGPYTASAIASIAFDLPHAVLDGNVIRVLSRVFNVREDVRTPQTRRRLQKLAESLLDREAPGDHNQALMELGALVCTPTKPDCGRCPLKPDCAGLATNAISLLPFKSRRPRVPHHDVVVGLIRDRHGRYLITKRPTDAMLGGLWEFPGGKREENESLRDALKREMKEELNVHVSVGNEAFHIRHAYTHFRITLHAFCCRIDSGSPGTTNGMPLAWVHATDMDDYAFPRASRKLIEYLAEDRNGATNG